MKKICNLLLLVISPELASFLVYTIPLLFRSSIVCFVSGAVLCLQQVVLCDVPPFMTVPITGQVVAWAFNWISKKSRAELYQKILPLTQEPLLIMQSTLYVSSASSDSWPWY